LSSKLEKLVLVREDRERGINPDVGKMVPHFQRCGFPLKRQPDNYLEHVRHDGDIKITIEANKVKIDHKGTKHFGMPFGADILTLLWCFTTALDTKSRTIKFKYAAKILNDMGLPPQTANYRAIVWSFERIFGCKYTFEWWEVVPGKGKKRHITQALLFDRLSLWFHENDDQMPLEGDGFENEIVLSEFAWNWLRRTHWFATGPAYALRQAPGAIQLYFVVASRGPRIKGPGDFAEIPITGPDGLDKQIGGVTYEGDGQKRWRQLLRKWLNEIKTAWPECPAQLVDLTGCTRYGVEKRGWYLQIGWFAQPDHPRN
jgi:hypothetical protein